ncbi:hydrogenase nickel incorporation protein HypB [candidate division KSB3 bacterium]|uniref:Hydrogenase nickel incorporation protein HypB n=1 Tax=candidate division KSB3 bacterium TaxID=2044937 RepID=A0A9D5Q7P8_9BACT|nr:hydrogenase nickel incorporation protein HypB [candidate division KSB3 bacterium]MBD3326668.1 hydrogenase nickel incorporation protein HypB [candidate division KSB3 bacterium]
MEIQVLKRVLGANEDKAQQIRARLIDQRVLMVNLISSPGSGKTTLLEQSLRGLQDTYTIAVIEGDVATDQDAQRLQPFNAQILLINTEGGCHLSSPSIETALNTLDLGALDLIFIENVGNLVCPAGFDLGEHAKVAVVSTAEGDDKPAKYPLLFRQAQLVILNKMDLLAHVNFDKERFYHNLQTLNADVPVIETSCTTGEGLKGWFDWVTTRVTDVQSL